MKINLTEIIMVFIAVILGLGLTNTVSDYGNDIVNHNTSSDIVKMIAPFIGVIWLVGCLGIAGLLAFHMYKSN